MVPQLSVLYIMEPLSLPNQRESCKVEKIVLVPKMLNKWKTIKRKQLESVSDIHLLESVSDIHLLKYRF